MNVLDQLNEPQRSAVSAAPGPVLVLAGPGSGKTRVLTHRIAYLIQEMDVPPWHILAVTFTNKAAREMRDRVATLLDGRLRGLAMGTFHASCVRILRREVEHLASYGRDFVIFDTADQRQVAKQALADLNLDEKKFQPNRMLHGISTAKNELITPEQYQATTYIAEVNRRVYVRYQEILQANNAMDFDDLLMNTVLLFDEHPDVLKRYQELYQQILVDEFQDTNVTQYALLQRLAAGHHNLFVVGDSDQSIYRWRGADYRNINRFRETYPDAKTILLEQNYRSTQIILDAAKAVIQRNKNRVHKELFTDRQEGQNIVVREAYNDMEEADTVIATIQEMMLHGFSLGDCAVMYRTNAQSRSLEEAFVRANMPYRLVGATQFYQRREVKDVIAYLRVVHNPADSVSFGRIVNTPPRGIGQKTLHELIRWANANYWQPAEALLKLAAGRDVDHPFAGRALNALRPLAKMLHAWITLRDQATVGELLDLILEQTQFRQFLDDGTQEGQDRWANVMELYGVAHGEPVTLSEFLEEVSLVSDVDNLEESVNAATLLTLHAAKGLEFPVVFIVGLEDGLLPHSRSLDDGEALAEERRLFYVGITRAMERLYLSHAFRRSFYGEAELSIPSRFLGDIPVELIDGLSSGRRRQESKARASSWSWSSSVSLERGGDWTRSRHQSANLGREVSSRARRQTVEDSLELREEASRDESNQPRFRTGQKVRHPKFGEGTVIESRLTGNDEEVSVAFPDLGVKRLAASFASLESIEG